MKYIVEFEDEPCMYEDDVHFYKCIQAPWWGLSEKVIKQLTPYQPEPDCVSRKTALDAFGLSEKTRKYGGDHSGYDTRMLYEIQDTLESLPAVQPDHTADSGKKAEKEDCISRQAAIDALWKALYEYEDETEKQFLESEELDVGEWIGHRIFVQNMNDIDRQTILNLPSAQPEQRYTEEELSVFAHGISLSLLSKRSSQHWQYDEDTATEIKFLERLYEKVVADIRSEHDG